MKLIIRYTMDGTAVPDWRAEEFVIAAVQMGARSSQRSSPDRFTISISTENVIYAARVLFKERKLPISSLTIEHGSMSSDIDLDGKFIDEYPDTPMDSWLARLL